MGFAVSFLAGIIPMFLFAVLLYLLDRYEKEPLPLLVSIFFWGAIVAAGAAFVINTLTSQGLYLITGSEFATQLTLSTLIAPIVEESLKGVAVLFVFLVFRSEFDSPLDGIIYAGITALGFAATENVWYIHTLGFLENGWQGIFELTIIRVFLVGWQHPLYTSFIGLGLAFSRRSTDQVWKWIFPFIGWSAAVLFHTLHNLFCSLFTSPFGRVFATIWDWSGYLGLFVLIILLIKREQRWMSEYLVAELEQELISSDHYQIACSAWRQTLVFLKSAYNGNYRATRQFYQVCGNLMHKKRQFKRHGDENGSEIEVQRLRTELANLSEKI